MTEAEWLAALEPGPMLAFLRSSGRASPRKLRLFDCACVRRVWNLLTDERSRKAVEVAERFADSLASIDELIVAQAVASATTTDVASAWDAGQDAESGDFAGAFANAADAVAYAATWTSSALTSRCESFIADAAAFATGSARVERAAQAALLRDIFGPSLFRSVSIEPSLLSWNNGAIERLAQAIYEERAFERMPILADALEDAGCYGEDILRHCREQERQHCRGCWVVDLLLGKE